MWTLRPHTFRFYCPVFSCSILFHAPPGGCVSYPGNRCPARCRCSCRWRAVHAVCKQSCVLVHFDSVGMASYVNHEVRTRGTPLFNLHSSSSGSVVDKGVYKVVLSTPQILERFGQAYVDLFNLFVAGCSSPWQIRTDALARNWPHHLDILWPTTGLYV